MLQIIRRCVQACVLLIVTAVALLSLYAHYRAARSIDDPQLMAGLRGEVVTQMIHPRIEKLDDPQAFLDGNKGTIWSMRLLGVSLSDPLAAAEMIAASKHIHWPMLVSIILPVVLTMIFGKVFCSWICPGYLLFEITGKLRRVLRFAEIKPGNLKFSHRNKYVLLCVGLLLATLLSAPLFAMIYPPAVVSRVIHAWIFGTQMAAMLILLGIIVAFELFVSPRWWCRTMCPGGALYGLLGWSRPVRIKLRRAACTGCMDCIPVCEEGINPITQSGSIECDNCGVCIRHCGDKALYFTIGLPGKAARTHHNESHTPPKSRGLQPARSLRVHTASKHPTSATDAKTKAATSLGVRPTSPVAPPSRRCVHGRDAHATGFFGRTLVALLIVFLFAEPAAGHHILGLPHYSYKENYPQRPTLEYPATSGPYDILLTSYPGVPNPGVPANLAFYIKNRQTKHSYPDPVSVRILKTSTFGDNTVVMPPTVRPPFDNEHKFQFTFPDDGEYIVELSVLIEGRTEVIPFLVLAGQPSAAASFAITGSFGIVLLFVVIRAVQKKRRRRRTQAGSVTTTVGALGASDGLRSGGNVP